MGQRGVLGGDVIQCVLPSANFFFPDLEPVSKKQCARVERLCPATESLLSLGTDMTALLFRVQDARGESGMAIQLNGVSKSQKKNKSPPPGSEEGQ